MINIGKLEQNPPSRFIKQAFQNDFEAGLDAMFVHLNKKVAHQFHLRSKPIKYLLI